MLLVWLSLGAGSIATSCCSDEPFDYGLQAADFSPEEGGPLPSSATIEVTPLPDEITIRYVASDGTPTIARYSVLDD
jgi:hypothetical protein